MSITADQVKRLLLEYEQTYMTNLAKGSATPKEAMDLAGHSDIDLTIG